MDTVENVKTKIEAKLKELEDLKKKVSRKCGEVVQNIPVNLYLKIEELEEEIEEGGEMMTKFRKGDQLICVPCGREVVVNCCGISETTLWCCDRPMKKKSKVKSVKK